MLRYWMIAHLHHHRSVTHQ